MKRTTVLVSLALAAAAPLLAGCFESDITITLSYDAPAQVPIPERVKKLAVTRFTGANVMDQRWADIVADKLSSELAKLGQQYHRYDLVDRAHLAAVLKEQDLKIMSSDQAVSAGKLAQVQALLFGNVRVQGRDEKRSRPQYDILSRTTKTVYYTYRYVLVSVNLTMTDIDTSKAIYSDTIPKEFDSDKAGDSWSRTLRTMGLGDNNPPPLDGTINEMVDAAVQEFVRKISPHAVSFKETLDPGGETVTTGNKLAKAGDHKGALDTYKAAMQEKPDDAGAVFNAGVMNEALKNFAEADALYDKAFQMGKKDKYIEARQRVRQESNGSKASS